MSPRRLTRPDVSRAAIAPRILTGAAALGAACLAVGVLAAGRRQQVDASSSSAETSPSSTSIAPARRVHAPSAAPCDVPVVRRDTLRDAQGRTYYLSPDAMVLRNGALLIAGHRSVWIRTEPDGRAVDGEQDAVLATVREASGAVRTFARPAAVGDALLRRVRATALSSDRWALLLSELPQGVDNAVNSRVWIAVLTRAGWESVTPVVPPSSIRVLDGAGVPLNNRGEHLLVALPAIRADDEFGALLVEGVAPQLRTRFVPLPGVAYVTSSFVGGTRAPALFAVYPPRGVARSGTAIHLHLPDAPGTSPRLITAGLQSEVHEPRVQRVPGGYRLVALERSRVNRSAPEAVVAIQVPDVGTPTVEPLSRDAVRLLSAHVDSADLLAAFTSHDSTSKSIDVTLFRRPGPGRGMRVPVSPSHADVLGLAWDGAGDAVIATLHGDLSQAMAPSLALTWITPRCRATSGSEDAR